MHLVALLQPAQDADGVLDRGLVHEDRLEAPFQRRVLLDVLAVFVERGRADGVQFAARQHRLEHVARRPSTPSAAPAPTSVCISSINRMMRPSDLAISCSTALSRSSNSPRYLAPATSAPRSSATSFLSRSPVGTSPLTMRCASPSTIAVLPTPGSPISTGLFLVRRLEDLDDAPNFFVAADHGVELALARLFGQVAAVLGQRLVLRLRGCRWSRAGCRGCRPAPA